MVARVGLLPLGVSAAATLFAGCGSSSRQSQAPTTTAACSANRYHVDLVLNGATGGLVGIVKLAPVGQACRLATTIDLSVRRADGALVTSVTGNPAALSVDRDLSSEPLTISWIWRNWCGRHDGLALVASAGGVSDRAPVTTPPRCDRPNAASTLARLPA